MRLRTRNWIPTLAPFLATWETLGKVSHLPGPVSSLGKTGETVKGLMWETTHDSPSYTDKYYTDLRSHLPFTCQKSTAQQGCWSPTPQVFIYSWNKWLTRSGDCEMWEHFRNIIWGQFMVSFFLMVETALSTDREINNCLPKPSQEDKILPSLLDTPTLTDYESEGLKQLPGFPKPQFCYQWLYVNGSHPLSLGPHL